MNNLLQHYRNYERGTRETMDNRMKEIERENKRMHDEVQEMTSQVSRLDYENRQLQKSYVRLQENVRNYER